MKTVKLFVAAVLLVFVGSALFAQGTSKTENIKVWGNCEMCKTRIEKAAKIDGVTKAEWNDETKILALVYNPAKVSSDEVQKKIAAAGHDTEKFKGDDKAYSNLPSCCKYERKK
jgi:periplasmic mercuric ion binding protein